MEQRDADPTGEGRTTEPARAGSRARDRPLLLFAVDQVLDRAGAARAVDAFRAVRHPEPIIWLDLSAVRSISLAVSRSWAASRSTRISARPPCG